jgi:hypothetical protein
MYLGDILLPRFRPREVSLELGVGEVRLRDAGVLRRRLRAPDIVASSSSRTARGVAVALATKAMRGRPIFLEVATDKEADAIRDALGIGFCGFGTIALPTQPAGMTSTGLWARVLSAAVWLALTAAVFDEHAFAIVGAGAYMVLFTASAIALVAFLEGGRAGGIALDPNGLCLNLSHLPEIWPYVKLADARPTPNGIAIDLVGHEAPITVTTRRHWLWREAASAEEREHMAAQIVSATQRAHGAGAVAPAVSERVAAFAKGGLRARAWLDRLDATAAALSAGVGYRGAGFEEADLWEALENHDAPADIRAAAARVLVRVAPDAAKPRVENVLLRVRDDDARTCITAAVEDDAEEIDDLHEARG